MKRLATVGALVAAVLMATGVAQAMPILDVSDALEATDPTQLGRLSRNGLPQDWTGGEPFPGVLNPTLTYRYTTYSVNVGITPFIQVLFDSVSVNTFVSAYDTSYAPNPAASPNRGLDVNWLGDAGTSGNFFGVDPVFFQVLVPLNHMLVIVVSTTANATLGVGDPFHLIVEGFIDSEYTDPPSVPEPVTVLLSGTGLALALLRRARRQQA